MADKEQVDLCYLVGTTIMSKRKRKGLSQAELAERLGIEQHSLSRIERGIFSPKLSRLQSIAHALDCSVAELFSNVESPTIVHAETIADLIEDIDPELQKLIVELVERTVGVLKKIDK